VLVINTGPSRRYGEQLRALIGRTTPEPVIGVLHLNLHPDYFLGNQAFADVPRYASAATREGMAREAKAYEDNLYRLCGDWMSGTEALLPDRDLPVELPGSSAITRILGTRWRLGEREFMLHESSGHTASDLVLVDRRSGIAFVGGLVFVDRIPTTPHARIGPWLASLERLQALTQDQGLQGLVPSHGPVRSDTAGIDQTRAYLHWLDASFSSWARQGWEMSEVLRAPLPAPFSHWAAVQTEYVRNVAHLYPAYERAAMAPAMKR
jgi:quinoprotein relay system zinc metallohydrolase 1